MAITASAMPMPVSVTASKTYWPAANAAMGGGIAIVEMGVLRLDRQLSAIRHRVARIDREIQDHVLELIGVGVDPPQPASQHRLKDDVAPKGMPQQIRHAADQLVDLDRLRLQRLLPREGEQPLREQRGSPSALARRIEVAFCSRVAIANAAASKIERADHHRQHIVEIVGDAARELAYSLHLLGLTERLLRLLQFRLCVR